ncbi:MAG: PilZ domain-containing protein [Pacificimonas sp.]
MSVITEVMKRDERARILRTGKLRVGSLERKVIFRDVSESGALIQCDVELETGEIVELDFFDLPPLRAKVRWERNDRFGVEFERRIELGADGKPTNAALNAAKKQQSFISWKD